MTEAYRTANICIFFRLFVLTDSILIRYYRLCYFFLWYFSVIPYWN